MAKVEQITFVRNGVTFEVPKGYDSLEAYARVMRLNFKAFAKRMSPDVKAGYESELEKLQSVGL